MKSRALVSAAAVAATTLVVTLGTVSAANAVTRAGQLNCSGTHWAQVTTDATAPGNGRWTKFSDPNATKTFAFPGGAKINYGYYQADVWQVTAAGFYSDPDGECY